MVEGATLPKIPSYYEYWAEVEQSAASCDGPFNCDRALLRQFRTRTERESHYAGYVARRSAAQALVATALGLRP